MGRPSLYTPELLDQIVERLAGGEPMAQICREDGMPTARTVRNWMKERGESVFSSIAEAREDGEEWLAAECLLIADTPREGRVVKEELVDGVMVVTEVKTDDMLGHRKLQIETRLKLLAKWNPRKYGDQVNVAGHLTLEQLVAGSVGKPDPEQSDGAE